MLRIALLLSALLCAAAESQPLMDPASAAGWTSKRVPARMQKEFAAWSLAPGPALRWSFTLRSAGSTDITCAISVEERCDRLRLRLANRGPAVQVSLRLADDTGCEWAAPAVAVPAGATAHEVVARLADFRPIPGALVISERPGFPLRNPVVAVEKAEAGTAYVLDLLRLDAESDPPATAAILAADLPAVLAAGTRCQGTLRCRLDAGAVRGGLDLLLEQDGQPPLALPMHAAAGVDDWRPGDERVFRLDADLPPFTAGGAYRLGLRGGDGAAIRLAAPAASDRVVSARRPGDLVAAVVRQHGVPALAVNGVVQPPLLYTAYHPDRATLERLAAAGVAIVSLMATPTDDAYGHAATAWTGPERWDFREFDRRMRDLLAGRPDLLVVPRLYLGAPAWWAESHPDDLAAQADGSPILLAGRPVPSWASPAWRAGTAESLRHFIAHVLAAPYADRILGFHLASGTTDEWLAWGLNEGVLGDASPVNQASFRGWLGERYGDDAGLRRAWGDGAPALAQVRIPDPAALAAAARGDWRDARTDAAAIDYARYAADLTADTIGYFAAVAKEACGRTRLVGAFHGYVLHLCGDPRLAAAGTTALRRVWDNPDIDFLACPTSYAQRDPIAGTPYMMGLVEGAMRAGKLWFDENDIRTSASRGAPGEWGRPAEVGGDVRQQERELAMVLTRGLGHWWFDVAYNRYDHPAVHSTLARLRRHGDELLAADRSPVDEVAVVLDAAGLALADPSGRLLGEMVRKQIPALHRLGAPIGWYDASDLASLPPRRLYVILAMPDPASAVVEAIARLRGDGRVLVFVNGAGVYREGAFDPAAAERLLGFPLAWRAGRRDLRTTIAASAWLPGLAGTAYGAGERNGTFAPARLDGLGVLGTLADNSPGLVLRQAEDHAVVWSASTNLPAALLAALARRAGVHRYIEGEDVLWASRDLLAVSAATAGARRIALPRPARVLDVYAGQVVAEGAAAFTADFAPGQTRLWRLLPPEGR